MMLPDRWARIEELYHAARTRPAEEWPAFLREACPDDSALRDEVASLLAHAPLSETVPAVPVAVALVPGATLAHYRIEARVGAGGMGEVFRGIDTRLQRTVAIKVASTAFNLRFRREAQALAALNHPHICTLFDVGPDYLVMEFVEGETLADRLLRGPLPLGDVLRFGTQITSALGEAHAKGITHRDLKPANVMLTRSGVKLLDFGLASLGDQSLTRTGAVMGTPAYMAPEQFQGRDAGPQTDIYALGHLLHEMATGKRPVLRPDEPPGLEPLPDTLAHLVTRCLAEDPDARWRTASEIGALLEWFVRGREPAPAVAGMSRRALLVGGGGAAIAATGVGAWAGWMARARREPAGDVLRSHILPPAGGRFVARDPTFGGIALSPDGRWLAYGAFVNGEISLWLHPLDPREGGGAARRLRGTERASKPFWSLDSKSIAFAARGVIYIVDVETEALRELTSLAQLIGFGGGAWLPGDRIVFSQNGTLFQISSTGGTAKVLVAPPEGESYRLPQWLAGDRVLYVAGRGDRVASGVDVISLANPKDPRSVTRGNVNVLYASASSHLLSWNNRAIAAQKLDPVTLEPVDKPLRVAAEIPSWSATVSRNGRLVYDASDSTIRLRWFDSMGTPLSLIANTSLVHPVLSHDGSLAAVASGNDVWLIDTKSKLTRVVSGANQPQFSPNDRILIVTAPDEETRTRNLFRVDASGGVLAPLMPAGENGRFASDWSSNGWVLYTEGGGGIWMVKVNPDGSSIDSPESFLAGVLWGVFSPESSPRWVAYQTNIMGQYEICARRFPSRGREFRISEDGGAYPKWTPRGVYYISPDGKMTLAQVEYRGDEVHVRSRQTVFSLPPTSADAGTEVPFFDVSPDGERFLITRSDGGTALTLITNWQALLTNP
jgi:Tol biopolymer transport system component